MANYIDGYIFPISKSHLSDYQEVAEKVADIWKEHGALEYQEYVNDDPEFPGTRSFINVTETLKDETIIFGWIVFESREMRNLVHKKVAHDPRMAELIKPLIDPARIIFDAQRMVYGGFKSLVESK